MPHQNKPLPIHRLEDLRVWNESIDLNVQAYPVFSKVRDFSIRDQLIRSSFSVPSNIAEGFGRLSNKEFIRFLKIALGSANELKTQLIITRRVELIPSDEADILQNKINTISAMIFKLIQAKSKLSI